MNLNYFVILCIFTLTNVNAFNSNRYAQTSSTKTSNNQEQVIPARYKIKGNNPNIDPNILHGDDFPEVEYPSSIMDSAKPFYINVSPFSDDVKSTFKTLVSGGTAKKATPTIVVNLKSNDNKKEKAKAQTATSKELIQTVKGTSEKNSKSKETNETVPKEPLNVKNDTGDVERHDLQLANVSCENEEMDYVIGIIGDLDEFITTLTDIETEFYDINNSTVKILDFVPLEETTIISNVTAIDSGNNDSIPELNEGFLHTEANPNVVKSIDYPSIVASSVTEGTTMTSFFNGTQGDFVNNKHIDNDNIDS